MTRRVALSCLFLLSLVMLPPRRAFAEVRAGAAKVDITDYAHGPVNGPMFAKALVVTDGAETIVLITVDAVAIGEIGRIDNTFLGDVRAALHEQLGVDPKSVLINASHCHGVIRADTRKLAVDAVKEAWTRLEPVDVGVATAREDRISENRRLRMKDGSEVDMRRAYSLPPDEEVAGVGPIDPEVGVLRIDRKDGTPLAVLYNFACHPIMGVPGNENTADFPAFASAMLEEALGHDAVALFVQGCAGDINPVRYKVVNTPQDAEPLGNLLGLSVLRAFNTMETKAPPAINISNEVISLPRGADLQERIATLLQQREKLTASLRPTDINFKSFLPLYIQHKTFPKAPSYHAQGYLHDRERGRDSLGKQDAENQRNLDAYLRNIHTMEKLTRLNTNLKLLQKHLATNRSAEKPTIDVEIGGIRIGDFRMVTFPGELTVEVGLRIKEASMPSSSFVAGYTNGYIYYLPTATQRLNSGYAQEDCDCLVAPRWQEIFETKAADVLKSL
ncbi:Neutral/alkaline non-lysosomal ceramidase [Planctomycetes bacterium Pan216]|uniref:Neutral/alkaline non-lysosomal ceramidase n=1 Tax=Kolteria novifilia TaxID=2527975 RepID=A0A518BB15_9BACT|nr:Neutral/alkaline non-lysosomal ceramidase [Planctomycetes bacterium Pan216]